MSTTLTLDMAAIYFTLRTPAMTRSMMVVLPLPVEIATLLWSLFFAFGSLYVSSRYVFICCLRLFVVYLFIIEQSLKNQVPF